jgi:hypothetical protein
MEHEHVVRDARALADHGLVLHKGVIAREATGGVGVAPGPGTLFARVHGDGARELCAKIALSPEVRAVSFRHMPGEPAFLELGGGSTEACALALIDAAIATGVEIEAIGEAAPTLGQVRASTEALWQSLRPRAPVAPPLPPAPPPAPAQGAGS